MKKFFLSITAAGFLLGVSIAPAQANILINNSAVGIVEGSIIQSSKGAVKGDNTTTVDVGVIEYDSKQGVQNVKVFGMVKGDIVTQPGVHISVGSYYAKKK